MRNFSKKDIEGLTKQLDFSKIEGGLIPIITQDFKTKEVLMVAFANKEAVELSLETGVMHYYSRSRQELWKKGETSGHIQEIKKVIVDCDNDTILMRVKQTGGACHKGYYSCFYRNFKNGKFIEIGTRIFNPEEVYNDKI